MRITCRARVLVLDESILPVVGEGGAEFWDESKLHDLIRLLGEGVFRFVFRYVSMTLNIACLYFELYMSIFVCMYFISLPIYSLPLVCIVMRCSCGRSPRKDCTLLGLWSACVSCCLLYTSPSPRDATLSRMPSSA